MYPSISYLTMLVTAVFTAVMLAAHPARAGDLETLRPYLPEVFEWSDGTFTIEVELRAQCVTLGSGIPRPHDCTDKVPGGGKVHMEIGRIAPPSGGPVNIELGLIYFEGFGVNTQGTLSGLIGFGPDGEAPLFSVPFELTFGSVTLGDKPSEVFEYGAPGEAAQLYIARMAGLGELGRYVLPDAPTSPGPYNLYLNITAVPEPETWAMLLAGLGLVGWAARWRK